LSNRIIIHRAVSEDFKLEVFASAPVDGSAGDYEDGRIIKYGSYFYSWHDATGSWKKFILDSDFSSLTTRLSTQEVGQATAESSLATIDASLQTRISTEESASTSAVDSAGVRATAAEGVISGNLSSELINRAADVSAEASRASSAEVVLSANLSSELVNRASDVSSEKSRAETAETSLQTRLAAEESNELSAETSLNLRASTEESTRLAADNSIAVTVSSEASSARSAETSLQTRLSSEEDRVDAVLNAASADKDTFVEIVSFINAIDVAADAQTSGQVSSVDSAIVSAESSRGSADTSLQTRLSIEESTEALAEVSLNTRMTAEASNELSAEGSLDVRSSSEESLRLAEDTSLETTLDSAGSSRASGDSSLTTAASVEASTARSAEVSVQSSTSAAALARGNADTSLTTRLSIEESAMIVAVDSIEALRSAGDLSLTTRVSSEEVTRAAGDSSLSSRAGIAESARSTADSSLTTRLASEESSELSAETSLDTRVSSEASAQVLADGSLQTRFSGEVSSERSKLDAILDSASADKDTFVEIVSFITSVDTASDDALASYVVSVDATISTEVSAARSSEAVLSTNLSSEISTMGSAVTATYATISGNIATHAASIDTKEQHEGVGRHMRIDFTSETSFSVAAVDLPSNFEPGNGMVQVFQLVSAGVYRNLIAPATYNASTGAMSFDLGSTAKSGFVVFYSFAGDEAEATEYSAVSTQKITAISSFAPGTASSAASIVFTVSGVDANNYQDHHNLTSSSIRIINNGQYLSGTGSFNAGYTAWTVSWTNNSSFGMPSGNGLLYVEMDNTSSTTYSTTLQVQYNNAGTVQTDAYLGLALATISGGVELSPGWFDGTLDSYTSYDTLASSGGKYFRGPSYTLSTSELRGAQAIGHSNFLNSGSNISNYYKGIYLFTYSGTDYYVAFGYSSGDRYDMKSTYATAISGRTEYLSSSYDTRLKVNLGNIPASGGDYLITALEIGVYRSHSQNTTIAAPSTDAVSFIIHNPYQDWSTNSVESAAQTGLKLDINKNASTMSVAMYRDTGSSSVTWTEVTRGYVGPHDAS
jgi:hypothetical protein